MKSPHLIPPLKTDDHIRGPAHALVTVVEYGDFECPYSRDAFEIQKRLQIDFGDQIRFAFRHFPLRQIHPHAELAAQASESAHAYGKFWKMHDLLFENQEALELPDLVNYAQGLDLDRERFLDDLKNRRYSKRILADFGNGIRSGVSSTPTFFLNEVRYEGNTQYSELFDAIQNEVDQEELRRAI